jgi:DNA-directed RNA polymerase specialized sigma24 family protein
VAKAATPDDIAAAVEALTAEDTLRLDRYARFRIRRIGRAADTRDHDDLLADALRKTLDGDRSWNKDVTFLAHLFGAMWSISSHWAETFAAEQRSGRAQISDRKDARTELAGVVDEVAERNAAAQETLDQVRALFADDALASNIVAGWEDGLDAAEIRELLGVDKTTFESKVRAIRRELIRAGLKRDNRTEGSRP